MAQKKTFKFWMIGVGLILGLYLLIKALTKTINTATTNIGASLGQQFGRSVSLSAGQIVNKTVQTGSSFINGLESQAIDYVGSKALGFIGKLLTPKDDVYVPSTTFAVDYTGDITYPGIDVLGDYGDWSDPAQTAAFNDAYLSSLV